MKTKSLKFKGLYRFIIMIAVGIILFSSCKKDDTSNPSELLDASGIWIATESVTGNCSGSVTTETKTEIFAIKQNGNNLTITFYPIDKEVVGTLTGNTIKWNGTLPTSSGNTTIDFTGTVNTAVNEFSGSTTWSWSSSTFQCSGSSQITGSRVLAETADFSGNWQGTWQSEESSYYGTFSVSVNQNDKVLSGKITVPEIDLNDADLTGEVNGNVVFFGDINGKIKFAGIIESDSGSGAYSYSAYSDEGSWTATRGGTVSKKLIPIESFPIDTEFDGCSDMAFDGTYFWLLSGNKIFKLGMDGAIIDIQPTPGSYANGIAYNGSQLLIGDNGWGTNKIYKLGTTEKNILALPGSGNIVALDTGNNGFWCVDDVLDNPTIYKINNKGEITSSLQFTARHIKGLCYDGLNLWLSYRNFNIFDNQRIAKIDTLGNILKTIVPSVEVEGGLAFDGKRLWFNTGNTFYKLDTLGNFDKTIDLQIDTEGDITIKNQYIYCVSPEYKEPSMLYQLDTLGNEIASFECPGTHQKGLTFDGVYLRLVDRVTEKMYSLPLDGDYYQAYPAFDFDFMSASGANVFVNNPSINKIVSLNTLGEMISSFSYPVEGPAGFDFDGENMWFITNELFKLNKLIQTDQQGNILNFYQADEQISPAHAFNVVGNNVWMILKDNNEDFYRLSKFELAD